MKPLLATLMLSVAALAPVSAFAAAPVAAPAPDTALDKLVALMVPEERIGSLAGKAFDAGMDDQIAADPAIKASFDGNPGLRQQIGDALRPQFTAILVAALPSLRTELSGIIGQAMTASEISDTLTFFSSSAGKKVRAELYEVMGRSPGQSPEAIRQAAITSFMAKMTAEDYPALMAFAGSPAAQKMGALNGRISAATQAWGQRLVAANSVRLQAQAIKLVADYNA